MRELTPTDIAAIRLACRSGMHGANQWSMGGSEHQWYLRRLASKVDAYIRRSGLYVVRDTNEPPPGWSVEFDRREELLALSEIASLRKVS